MNVKPALVTGYICIYFYIYIYICIHIHICICIFFGLFKKKKKVFPETCGLKQ